MRRKVHYDTQSHISKDRWMVSYADFITLLFGFFVVMYAVSTFENEGKYRVISDSIIQALTKPEQPSQIDPNAQRQIETEAAVSSDETSPQPPPPPEDVTIKSMADSVRKVLQPWIEMGLITINQSPIRLEIEINASVLYDSGSAELAPDAEPILHVIAELLQQFPNAIHIEGFTDNRPISNSTYPSNWELSSARAAAVVRMFRKKNIEPERMAAIGYGEFRPIADNSTIEGRNRNRRIVVVVLSGGDPRDFVEIVKQAEPKLEALPVDVKRSVE